MRTFNLKTAKYLAGLLYDKKASDILILNVRRFTMASEYFVIATANSQVHRRTLIDELLKKGKGAVDSRVVTCLKPLRIEGTKESHWVVADYGGVMVHIMSPEERRSVALENLYDGARRQRFPSEKELKMTLSSPGRRTK